MTHEQIDEVERDIHQYIERKVKEYDENYNLVSLSITRAVLSYGCNKYEEEEAARQLNNN